MSTVEPTAESDSKFTRGEKCLFTHIVITFSLIIAVVIGYYGHACLVRHRGNLGPTFRRADGGMDQSVTHQPAEFRCVGTVTVREENQEKVACGSALLTERWSLVAARCVSAWAHPKLSHLLPFWMLRYELDSSGIRRGVPHPKYDGDDAANDVGLFEHDRMMSNIPLCSVPSKIIDNDALREMKSLYVVEWQISGDRASRPVNGISSAECIQFTSLITDQIGGLCVMADTYDDIDDDDDDTLLGGMLFETSQLIGVPSWGNAYDFPLVIVDLAKYKDWIQLILNSGLKKKIF